MRDVKNMQSLEQVEIHATTKQALAKMIQVEQHTGQLLEMRNFCICCMEYIQKNLPLDNGFLKAVQCLQPAARTITESEGHIKRLARKLPQAIADTELSSLTDEWKLYAFDETPTLGEVKTHEVDRYWADVLDRKNALGKLKFCTLSKVVRVALSVSHRNSDAEHGFSAYKQTVTPERSPLNEELSVH